MGYTGRYEWTFDLNDPEDYPSAMICRKELHRLGHKDLKGLTRDQMVDLLRSLNGPILIHNATCYI